MNTNKHNKKVAFYFDRSVLAKFYAPVAIECIKQDIEAFFICGPDPYNSWSSNLVYRPLKENIKIPFIDKIKFIYFDTFEEAEKEIAKNSINNIFVTHAINSEQEIFIKKIKKNGVKINCIQWAGDYLTITPEKLKLLDNLFVNSPEMIELYFKHFPEASRKDLLSKFIPTGNPIFDFLKEKETKEKILKKYGIPEGKKIVLVMSLNLGVLPWWRHYFGAPNAMMAFLNFFLEPNIGYLKDFIKFGGYRNILRSIKDWCRENDALLVIKNRPKYKEPSYVTKLADVMAFDDSFYPVASVELVSVADLVIGFGSSVVLEAGSLGVRSISIDTETKSKISWRRTLDAFSDSGIFDAEGLVDNINYHVFTRYLNKHKLGDFIVDQEKRKEYVDKFLGYCDYNASKRIIDHLSL